MMFDCRKDLFIMYGCLSLVEGYSVNEVIETCEKVTGRKDVMESTDRRLGTSERLVASSQKIYEELGWKAEYSLEQIIESAWKWHRGKVKEIQSLLLKECC
jgi:UDP-glucose 4-epimerase